MDMSLSELREFVMDSEAWRAVIHGVAKSQTRLSDFLGIGMKTDLSSPVATAKFSKFAGTTRISGSLSCGSRASAFRTPTAGSLQSWDRRVIPVKSEV